MDFTPQLVNINKNLSDDKWKTIVAFDVELTGPRIDKHYMNAIGYSIFYVKDHLSPREKFNVDKHILLGESVMYSMLPPSSKHVFDPKTKKEFWNLPENHKLLKKWAKTAQSPEEVMSKIVDMLNSLQDRRMEVVVDCVADSLWIDYYLAFHADSNPLYVFGGKYRGWPTIVDDVYRGYLGISDMWGIDGKIDQRSGVIPKIEGQSHDPAYDSAMIGLRYAIYSSILK